MNKLIALLFYSRDVAHRAHLMVTGEPGSLGMHLATGEFYDAIIDLADSVAEVWIGRNGPITDIEFITMADTGEIADELSAHLDIVKEMRTSVLDPNDTVIQNKMDEIEEQYSHTLMKLRTLK